MLDKPLYTKAELLEAIRRVMYYGDPELYDRGGIHQNAPGTNTRKRAEEAFNKYVVGGILALKITRSNINETQADQGADVAAPNAI